MKCKSSLKFFFIIVSKKTKFTTQYYNKKGKYHYRCVDSMCRLKVEVEEAKADEKDENNEDERFTAASLKRILI